MINQLRLFASSAATLVIEEVTGARAATVKRKKPLGKYKPPRRAWAPRSVVTGSYGPKPAPVPKVLVPMPLPAYTDLFKDVVDSLNEIAALPTSTRFIKGRAY